MIAMDAPMRAIPWLDRVELPVHVTNRGAAPWPAMGAGSRHLVTLGYRWLDATGRVLAASEDAGRLPWDVAADETVPAHIVIRAPGTRGATVLAVGAVQDGAWFEGTVTACFAPSGTSRACPTTRNP